VKKSFIITRATLDSADAAALLSEIVEGTGSEQEAASVMRSLERMGVHPALEYYEITQITGRKMHGGPVSSAWRVRADFGAPAEDAEGAQISA
jgi:hypothetical protein